jgi:hypothetical protein
VTFPGEPLFAAIGDHAPAGEPTRKMFDNPELGQKPRGQFPE